MKASLKFYLSPIYIYWARNFLSQEEFVYLTSLIGNGDFNIFPFTRFYEISKNIEYIPLEIIPYHTKVCIVYPSTIEPWRFGLTIKILKSFRKKTYVRNGKIHYFGYIENFKIDRKGDTTLVETPNVESGLKPSGLLPV